MSTAAPMVPGRAREQRDAEGDGRVQGRRHGRGGVRMLEIDLEKQPKPREHFVDTWNGSAAPFKAGVLRNADRTKKETMGWCTMPEIIRGGA